MSVRLSYYPRQAFYTNSGGVASGYFLFVYSAGTTTKATTYSNESGTQNANPIVLDSRGECNLWLTSATGYKFVLAPSTDSDPPQNPEWSQDNVVPADLTATINTIGIASSSTTVTGTSGVAGGGALTANRTLTLDIDNANTWAKRQSGSPVTLTDAATITPNFALGNNYNLTLTSAVGSTRQIANPSNIVAGQSGVICITQDATGGKAVTWGSYFKFQGGSFIGLTGTGNSIDVLSYYARTTTGIDISLSMPNVSVATSVEVTSSSFDFNAFVAAGSPSAPGSYIFNIASGVVIGATATTSYAFDTGVFPSGSTITINNNGTIIGAGGNGGSGAESGNGNNGSPGGVGLYARQAITLNNLGTIAGGGGGGGGGGGKSSPSAPGVMAGGNGGGGAGSIPGAGAVAGGYQAVGSAGTTTAGGAAGAAGGTGPAGGAGGNPGLAGGNGSTSSAGMAGGTGGAAGYSIYGISNVTWSATGTLQGATA